MNPLKIPGQLLWKSHRFSITRSEQWAPEKNLELRSGLVAGGITALVVMGLWSMGVWRPFERIGYNMMFQLRHHVGILPNPGWDDRLIVIAIDEASLKRYGRFPLSRNYYAELLDQLSIAPPAAIGFDILLAESTPQDEQLAESITFSGGNVVLAIAGDHQRQTIELARDIQQVASTYLTGSINQSVDMDGINRQARLTEGDHPSLGLAMFQICQLTTADTVGVGISARGCEPTQTVKINEHDGTNRWINWPGQLPQRSSGEQDAACQPSNGARTPTQAEALASHTIPAQLLPNVQSPRKLCIYSLVEVLNGTVNPEFFQNQLVLVGYTATGLDPARTPLNVDPPTAGVYVHAAILDNLLNNRFLKKLPIWAEFQLLAGLSLASGLLLNRHKFGTRVVIAVILPLMWLIGCILAFTQAWWVPVAAPISSFLLAAGFVQLQEQRDKQQLMELFAQHVAPETAQLIWQRRGELITQGKIQPQELTATVLFIDIRNFTGISEQLPSKHLLDWLNQYFEAMTDCIMQHGGVVDKYIGDAIMAVFGVPFPGNDTNHVRQDAQDAIAACLAMHHRLKDLNQELQANQQPTINFGIGLHTGPVIAGTVGNRQRLNYSIFGDTVNIAARLEARTKALAPEFPYRVLMTETTYHHIKGQYPGKIVDTLTLRGRQGETIVYTLDPRISDIFKGPSISRANLPKKTLPRKIKIG